MRIIFSLGLIFTLAACSSVSNPEKVYLRNPRTGEIVKCEESGMDSWFSALEMCAKSKESDGYVRIDVLRFNRFGQPAEYKVQDDPYWPDN